MKTILNNFLYMNVFIGTIYVYSYICKKEKKSVSETEPIHDYDVCNKSESRELKILNKCYKNIYYVSYLSFIPSLYGLYRKYYDLSLMSGGVTLTSINFWRNPDFSWRRELDIHFVRLSILYHLFRAYKSENRNAYYILSGSAITFYPIGVYFFIKKKYTYFMYSHILVHLIGDLSNIILYCGYVPKITFCD